MTNVSIQKIILLNGNIHTKIVGCLHEPYNGKWVVEIQECPHKSI